MASHFVISGLIRTDGAFNYTTTQTRSPSDGLMERDVHFISYVIVSVEDDDAWVVMHSISLTCRLILDHCVCWFYLFELPMYAKNMDCIDECKISQFTCIRTYVQNGKTDVSGWPPFGTLYCASTVVNCSANEHPFYAPIRIAICMRGLYIRLGCI